MDLWTCPWEISSTALIKEESFAHCAAGCFMGRDPGRCKWREDAEQQLTTIALSLPDCAEDEAGCIKLSLP